MRTTRKQLEGLANRINAVTGSPLESYVKRGDKWHACPGNFHIDGAYGGYALHRMSGTGGGVEDISQVGHVRAGELWTVMQAILRGIQIGMKGGK